MLDIAVSQCHEQEVSLLAVFPARCQSRDLKLWHLGIPNRRTEEGQSRGRIPTSCPTRGLLEAATQHFSFQPIRWNLAHGHP